MKAVFAILLALPLPALAADAPQGHALQCQGSFQGWETYESGVWHHHWYQPSLATRVGTVTTKETEFDVEWTQDGRNFQVQYAGTISTEDTPTSQLNISLSSGTSMTSTDGRLVTTNQKVYGITIASGGKGAITTATDEVTATQTQVSNILKTEQVTDNGTSVASKISITDVTNADGTLTETTETQDSDNGEILSNKNSCVVTNHSVDDLAKMAPAAFMAVVKQITGLMQAVETAEDKLCPQPGACPSAVAELTQAQAAREALFSGKTVNAKSFVGSWPTNLK